MTPIPTILWLTPAAWLIYRSGAPNTKALLGLFVAQLSLNALWSWTFIKWESGLGSMATIIGLWLTIIAALIAFWRVNPTAGVPMLPYLLWVSFAAILNGAIWRLNPGLL